MSNKLNNYANYHAGKKEDNVFKVFVYLNTQKYEFSPFDIRTRVSVSNKTILSYLWEIAKSQTCDPDFMKRINAGADVQWYTVTVKTEKEREIASKVYDRLTKMKVQSEPNQFTLTQDSKELKRIFYYRLEQSLLFYMAVI